MKFIKYRILPFIILFQSCAAINQLPVDSGTDIRPENIGEFNGVYENVSSDSLNVKTLSFWMCLKENSPKREWGKTKVKLEFKNRRSVRVDLIDQNGFVVKNKTVHGKLRDGYFYIRRKFMIFPFFPILYGYLNKKSRFCLDGDSLHIDFSRNLWIFALMAGADADEELSFKCKKQNANK